MSVATSRPGIGTFLYNLFTDGYSAFDVLDGWARVDETSSVVQDLTNGMDTWNKAAGGAFDVIVRPAKAIVNDLDLQADWLWFKTILADVFIIIFLAMVVLFVLVLLV